MCLNKKEEEVSRTCRNKKTVFADNVSELDTKSSILALSDSAIAFEGY